MIGGRLDYLDNRPVAALVYQRRKHFINLFVWPASDASSKDERREISHQGYQLLHWVELDFNYWAVSDVSVSDLQTFQAAVRSANVASLINELLGFRLPGAPSLVYR